MIYFPATNEPVRVWYFTKTGDEDEQRQMAAQVRQHSRNFVGRVVLEEEYAQLVAAHPGDTVTLLVSATPSNIPYIQVTLDGQVALDQRGLWRLYRVKYGLESLSSAHPLSLLSFAVDPNIQRHGVAASVLAQQAQAAHAQGYSTIDAYAEGDRNKGMNGHYTWPRLGFDAALTPTDIKKLPADYRRAAWLHDLFATEEGRCWWRDNGWSLFLDFNTSPHSISMTVLRSYFSAKGYVWPASPQTTPSVRLVLTRRASRNE